MAASLEGVLQRVQRAAECLQDVRGISDRFIALDGAKLSRGIDPASNEYWITVSELPAPPRGLGVHVSEFAHHCRSALDNLAWELVQNPSGPIAGAPPPKHRTYFPLATHASQYKPLTGITPGAQSTIEALQPYHAGAEAAKQPLAILSTLSNKDKHRHMHFAASALGGGKTVNGEPLLERVSFAKQGPISDRMELVRYRLRNDAPADAKVDFVFAIGLTFANGSLAGTPIEATLEAVIDTVIHTLVSLVNELELDESSADPFDPALLARLLQ